MKIAIDIDEVVVGFVENFMRFVETKGLKGVNIEDVFSYDLWEVLGVSKKKAFELFDEYNFNGNDKNPNFINGSKEGVCFLKEKFDIYFITARPKSILKETRNFIFENFSILGDKVIFSGEFDKKNKTKDEICRDLGIDLIIEDNGRHSFDYAENGLRVLLLDKPWNRDFEHKNIIRCYNWEDILDKIKGAVNEKIF